VGATSPAARPDDNSLLPAADGASSDAGGPDAGADAGATSPVARHAAEDGALKSMGSKDEGATSPAARPDENSLLPAADGASSDAGAPDAGATDAGATTPVARHAAEDGASTTTRLKDEEATSLSARLDKNTLLAAADGTSTSRDARATSPADRTPTNLGKRDVRATSPAAPGRG